MSILKGGIFNAVLIGDEDKPKGSAFNLVIPVSGIQRVNEFFDENFGEVLVLSSSGKVDSEEVTRVIKELCVYDFMAGDFGGWWM